jgi:hypothetical protein
MFAAALAAAATGCGGGKDPREKPVFPASGRVLVNDRPAHEARVMLVPVGTAGGGDGFTPNPFAQVREDGSFEITTYAPGDGAPAGEYAVVVEWRKGRFPGSRDRGPDLLNKKYRDPKRSPLRVQITEGKNDLPPFHLKVDPNTLDRLSKVKPSDD